jgi:uncharacterized phage protein (TIGR01671 family)
MREIKHKAWDKKEEKWIFLGLGSWLGVAEGHLREFYLTEDGGLGEREYRNPYELIELTGLKDKNGKEIYESDLLQVKPDGVVWETRFEDGGFVGHNEALNDQVGLFGGMKLEVIGNIYSNPELLN